MKAVNTMKAYPEMKIEIHGFTDSIGHRDYNIGLSLARAEAVRDYLVNHGIDATRIVAKGFGPDHPVAPNNTADGRSRNRRIEFMIVN